jgi:COMPASS component SWD3
MSKLSFMLLILVTTFHMNLVSGATVDRQTEPSCPNAPNFWVADISPDGKLLADNGDKRVRLWNIQTGIQVGSLPVDNTSDFRVQILVFSPDSRTLLVSQGSFDGGIAELWDVQTHRKLRTYVNEEKGLDGFYFVSFLHDGKSVITVDYKKATAWNIATGKRLYSFAVDAVDRHDRPFQLSADGSRIWSLVWNTDEGGVVIWDTLTGKKIKSFSAAYSADISPDSQKILIGSTEETIIVDAHTFETLLTLEAASAGVWHFSLDGKYLLKRESRAAPSLWSAETGKKLHTFEMKQGPYIMRFMPDGDHLLILDQIVTHDAKKPQTRLTIWDIKANRLSRNIDIPIDPLSIFIARISDDGKAILLGEYEGPLSLWSLETGKLIRTFC